MVYYSQKYADKQKRDRNQMIERAKELIAHPQKYNRVTASGSAAYINNIKFDKSFTFIGYRFLIKNNRIYVGPSKKSLKKIKKRIKKDGINVLKKYNGYFKVCNFKKIY